MSFTKGFVNSYLAKEEDICAVGLVDH